MFATILATAAAIAPFAGAPAVDGATTFYASFDQERQPDYGFVTGEPFGNALRVPNGRFGHGLRLFDEATAEFPLAEEAWNRDEGTIEFWLRPEWDVKAKSKVPIVSLVSNRNDRLYINRDSIGRLGVTLAGGSSEASRWTRIPIAEEDLLPGRWHALSVSWEDGQLDLRIDGRLISTPRAAPPMDLGPNRLKFGTGDFTIDEFRISKVRRSSMDESAWDPRPLRPGQAFRRHDTNEPPGSYDFEMPRGNPDESRFRLATPHYSEEPERNLRRSLPQAVGIDLKATKGEREPAKLVVYGLDDLEGVRVRLLDAPVPDLGLEVRRVVRSPVRKNYRAPIDQAEVVPRFLISEDGTAIPRGEFREFWLSFDIPKSAPAGVFSGRLELSVPGSPPTPIPFKIEIHPFELQQTTRKRMGMYYMPARRLMEPKRLAAELADMRAHGVTDVLVNLGLRWAEQGGEPVLIDSDLERFVDAVTAAGFDQTIVVSSGLRDLAKILGEERKDEMTRAARRGAVVLKAMDERFPGRIAVFHYDEIFNGDRLDKYIRLSRIARETGYPRLYVSIHTLDESADAKRRRVTPWVDIRGHHGYTFEWWLGRGHTIAEYEEELRAAGSEAWFYHNPRGSYFPPIWGRIINGIYLRASPFVLQAPWVYQDYRGNPYDDSDSSRPDLGFAFPEPGGRQGIAPTLTYEQMREGQDDARMLEMLESLARSDAAEYAHHLRWLESVDGLTRNSRPTARRNIEPADTGDPSNPDVDLDTGLRFSAGVAGTREEAPVIDALSRRLGGRALDEIRLEAAHRIGAILRRQAEITAP